MDEKISARKLQKVFKKLNGISKGGQGVRGSGSG
jgi:hypothetical protein